jgi:hypothetical protein
MRAAIESETSRSPRALVPAQTDFLVHPRIELAACYQEVDPDSMTDKSGRHGL